MGVLSNASVRELQRQQGKITAYAQIGREIDSEFDFNILKPIIRSTDVVNKAFANIQQNQDKVNHALFWFINASPFDNTAIEYLKNEDLDKAVEIWDRVTNKKEINSGNFSAFNNLGTCKLLSTNKNDIQEGIEAKIELIESNYFKDFAIAIVDETFTIDNDKQIKHFIDELLGQFKGHYTASETIDLFSGCNGVAKTYLIQKLTGEPLHKIERQIENTKDKRKEDPEKGYEIGMRLYVSCKDDLSFLKSILGVNDLKYRILVDNVAKEMLQCGIDYFNHHQEINSTENYLENALRITKSAKSIAAGQLIKDRIKDNLATLEGMKDRELSEAIAVLSSIKLAFTRNEIRIVQEVNAMPLGYNQTINWTKVSRAIHDSLDWNKAVDLVLEAIPERNVEKIKLINDPNRINEYKSLVEFLLKKLNYSQKRRVAYLQYWSTTNSSTTRRSSPYSEGVPSSSGPTWAEENMGCILWIVGIILFFILANTCS